jgi:hypothetical protein
MANWGTAWGTLFPWGAPIGEFEQADCETAECRVLMQHRGLSTTNMIDLACVIGRAWGNVRDVYKDIREAFDLDTAVGEQLDIIGSTVGLMRDGYNDTDYRRLIRIQILLILQSTGTPENIVAIIRTYLGTTANPVFVYNTGAKAFGVSASDMTEPDWELLISFIRKALPSEVAGTVAAAGVGGLVFDSVHAGPAIPDTGNWGSVHAGAPIADTGVWGYQIVI